MNEEAKKRMQGMLLAEIKIANLGWYYISCADHEFRGGYLIQARGPTEAWSLFHRLGWYPYGTEADTQTHGPIPENIMLKIPEEKRWRRLNAEEAKSLGE